ncbi:hypothetical protein J1C56_32050 [Aminobacter anthyllidis]|uniref:Uncharacterized protein n=1 Tax=Aminobacter anthyllidis TaxID=1035067 RepID=A0A9X1AHN9_9HYPH|nr:hypothetical protein [Aminobacter anthyllidis]MBT1160165.1 hypothetical protein [Aminobacter anthyllidis]
MKFHDVREQLRTVGVLISKRGCEIRINHFGGTPETAFFTSSLDEALAAGLSMARPKHLPKQWCSQR